MGQQALTKLCSDSKILIASQKCRIVLRKFEARKRREE